MLIRTHCAASEVLRDFTADGRVLPAHFWGNESDQETSKHPIWPGYAEARSLIGQATEKDLAYMQHEGLEILKRILATLDTNHDSGVEVDTSDGEKEQVPASASSSLYRGLGLVDLRLSEELLAWKRDEHSRGRILPGKGKGLRRVSEEFIKLLGLENWPAPMLTSNVMLGTNWANMLIGAYNEETLYSNCCNDMGFYYEHGYDKVFPEFEEAIRRSVKDPDSCLTPSGALRRNSVENGLQYIRGKARLEKSHATKLGHKMAKLNRRAAHLVCFCEASLAGMAAEAIGRGYDPAAVFDDAVAGSPGTDVVDVGSDLHNCEVMNSFLNTADFTDTGVVTEDALRRVYDAYAAFMARLFTERWMEPTINMTSLLYTWEILNDRHHYLRRIVLGYAKVRRPEERIGQREADFEEVFDEDYHTTGFSRPLANACDGHDTCSAVKDLINKAAGENIHTRQLLSELWFNLVEEPLCYAREGIVDSAQEERIIQALSLSMAKCYHFGLVLEQQWLIAHASQHAWQVSYLMEAAMFGSLLDDASLVGKLDRAD
ncbi:hypothetical protein G7054_g9726 [Neopestalotiopsis clavispora]|nr:hypothetical protein G7054_g9726 [Neopestalotiopsis clavispora]